jgi:hypothetical protein
VHRVADCVGDRVRLGIPQAAEWQRVGTQSDAAAYKLSRNFVHFFPYLSLVNDRMRKHLFLIERLCRYCNRAFTPASHNQKYCSYACRANAKLEKGKPLDQEIERCSYCDSAFMPASHNQKYCCRACRAKAQQLLEQNSCHPISVPIVRPRTEC